MVATCNICSSDELQVRGFTYNLVFLKLFFHFGMKHFFCKLFSILHVKGSCLFTMILVISLSLSRLHIYIYIYIYNSNHGIFFYSLWSSGVDVQVFFLLFVLWDQNDRESESYFLTKCFHLCHCSSSGELLVVRIVCLVSFIRKIFNGWFIQLEELLRLGS